jgi:tol-pal system protein YbgF
MQHEAKMTRTKLFLGAGLLSVLAVAAVAPVGAVAPDTPLPNYVLPQREMRVAGLFGESDAEKAARLQREQNQDDAINRLNDKIRDLEATVRMLTGQNEELAHRVTELDNRIDRQQKDFEYRLCAMAAQQLGASTGTGDPNAVPCPGTSGAGTAPLPPATVPPQAAASNDGGPVKLAPPPGVLGTLPAGAAPAAAAPENNKPEFDAAGRLLAKGSYDEAAAAFRQFADSHPKDPLAPNALYWVANIAYVQKNYQDAARLFAEVIQKYPTSTRAADSMLKIGQSLIADGQTKKGCTALAALPAKYPKADAKTLAQGAALRKASCRGD